MEIVPEGIEFGQGSIRPSGRNTLDDEHALPRQPRAGRLDFLDIDIQCSCDRGCSEFAAHDARCGEKVTVTLAELVDLAVDEASDIVRDRHELIDGLIPTCMGKPVDDAAHEKWIAACPIEQQGCQVRGQGRSLMLSKPSLQVTFNGLEAERIELDLAAASVQDQFRHQRMKARLFCCRISGSEGCQNHEASRIRATRHMAKPVDGGGVAPVNVLEFQYQGDVRRDRFER